MIFGDIQLDPPKPSDEPTPARNAIRELMSDVLIALDDKESVLSIEHWLDESDELETAYQFIQSELFHPDRWLQNLKEVTPLLSSHPISRVPKHTRERLKEIFRAYIFGNCMGCIALSRSLLEYALIDRASNLGYDAYDTELEGKRRTKRLYELIDRAIERHSELGDDMRAIEEYGNDVMHPEKSKKVRAIVYGANHARDCIERIWRVVPILYESRRPKSPPNQPMERTR